MADPRSDRSRLENTRKHVGPALLIGYLLSYASALHGMHRAWHFEIAEPLFILGILGGVFSLAAWLLTIGTAPLNYRVTNPARELAVLLTYMLPLAAYITWGGSAIGRSIAADPWNA